MLTALLYFLIGCIVLVVVIYAAKIVLGMLELPPEVSKLVMIVIGLIGVIILLFLVMGVLQGGGHPISW